MKEKKDLSLICVYNNKEQLDKYLLKSYKKQNIECQLILIDNRNNKFACAVDAINDGIKKATTTNIIILHQDIYFEKEDVLIKLYERIDKSHNEIIGVAGTKYEQRRVYTAITHGLKKEKAGLNVMNYGEEEEVFVLEECLFGFKKDILKKINFDNQTCDNWHFYAVDLCYQANLNNIKVICYGANIWHASSGSKTHSFYETLRKMQKKYKKNFNKIISCCIEMPINDHVLKYELKEKYRVWRWCVGPKIRKIFGIKRSDD